jgi:hypothetical protein
MLDEVARWDDPVTGLRSMTYGTKGEPIRCLVSVGPTIAAKASSEGWRLRLRPNTLLAILSSCTCPFGNLQPLLISQDQSRQHLHQVHINAPVKGVSR